MLRGHENELFAHVFKHCGLITSDFKPLKRNSKDNSYCYMRALSERLHVKTALMERGSIEQRFVWFLRFLGGLLCLFYLDRTVCDNRKALGEERGAVSAKDLKTGIELGSPWAQLRCMSTHYPLGYCRRQTELFLPLYRHWPVKYTHFYKSKCLSFASILVKHSNLGLKWKQTDEKENKCNNTLDLGSS